MYVKITVCMGAEFLTSFRPNFKQVEYHEPESPKRGVDLYFGGSILFYSLCTYNKW